jgi:DNA-binding transcriptional ArsR family regulator
MDAETAEPVPEAGPYEDLRRLSDARELRALAHPVRMALYQVLAVNESLTATQASKLVGGSPSSVAYHLRTLARYGYVEETNDGTGRERPWKLSHIGFRFSDETSDPETKAAAHALSRELFKRWLERREAYQQDKERWSEDVRDAVGDWNTIIFGTPDELRELQDAIGRLTKRFHDRITDPELRPEGWQTFEFQLFTHPIDTADFVPADDEES